MQFGIVGGTEERVQALGRFNREQLLDNGRQGRRIFGQRANHIVLYVSECRLGGDGHRGVVTMPPGQPRRFIHIGRAAKERDIGQARGPPSELGRRSGHRNRLGDQIGGHEVGLRFQGRHDAPHLVAVMLLHPHTHQRLHRWVECGERHQ